MHDGKYLCVDGDRDQLAEILETIATTGGTLVGYNIDGYDLLILRAVLAGVDDPYAISRQSSPTTVPDLPPELRDRANLWPRIKADVIDLAARTRRPWSLSRAQTGRSQPELPAPAGTAL